MGMHLSDNAFSFVGEFGPELREPCAVDPVSTAARVVRWMHDACYPARCFTRSKPEDDAFVPCLSAVSKDGEGLLEQSLTIEFESHAYPP
jgi:hypothetical protein